MDYLTSMPADQDLTGADIAQMMADIKDLSGANNITGKDMAIAFGVLGGLATGQGNPKHVKWWTKGAGALYDAFGTGLSNSYMTQKQGSLAGVERVAAPVKTKPTHRNPPPLSKQPLRTLRLRWKLPWIQNR